MNNNYATVSHLSFSAFGDLAVSAFNFWFRRISPDRPAKKTTKAMEFGDKFHCFVFENERFHGKYATDLNPRDYPEAVRGGAALKEVCKNLGLKQSGSVAELESRIRMMDPSVILWSDIELAHEKSMKGKEPVSSYEIANFEKLRKYILLHPDASRYLNSEIGENETVLEWMNDFQVPMKGKVDRFGYIEGIGNFLLELKTFSNSADKPLSRAVSDTFAYDLHWLQYAVYQDALLKAKGIKIDLFVTIFAESGETPSVIVRTTKPEDLTVTEGGRLYEELSRKFLRFYATFGYDKPWFDESMRERQFDEKEFPFSIFEATV